MDILESLSGNETQVPLLSQIALVKKIVRKILEKDYAKQGLTFLINISSNHLFLGNFRDIKTV